MISKHGFFQHKSSPSITYMITSDYELTNSNILKTMSSKILFSVQFMLIYRSAWQRRREFVGLLMKMANNYYTTYFWLAMGNDLDSSRMRVMKLGDMRMGGSMGSSKVGETNSLLKSLCLSFICTCILQISKYIIQLNILTINMIIIYFLIHATIAINQHFQPIFESSSLNFFNHTNGTNLTYTLTYEWEYSSQPFVIVGITNIDDPSAEEQFQVGVQELNITSCIFFFQMRTQNSITNIYVNYLVYENIQDISVYSHFMDNITDQSTIQDVFLVNQTIQNKEYLILLNGFHIFLNATNSTKYSYDLSLQIFNATSFSLTLNKTYEITIDFMVIIILFMETGESTDFRQFYFRTGIITSDSTLPEENFTKLEGIIGINKEVNNSLIIMKNYFIVGYRVCDDLLSIDNTCVSECNKNEKIKERRCSVCTPTQCQQQQEEQEQEEKEETSLLFLLFLLLPVALIISVVFIVKFRKKKRILDTNREEVNQHPTFQI